MDTDEGVVAQIVVVIPLTSEAGFILEPASELEVRGWSGFTESRSYPEQFRSIFFNAQIVDVVDTSSANLYCPPDVTILSCRLLLYDRHFGVATFLLAAPSLDKMSEEEAQDLYWRLLEFQESGADKLLAGIVRQAKCTMSFTINVLGVGDEKPSPNHVRPSHLRLCNAYDSAVETGEGFIHKVCSTGAICIIEHREDIEQSAARVLALWAIFASYFAYMLEDYEMTAREPIPRINSTLAELKEKYEQYTDLHTRISRQSFQFDPFNICVRSFDEYVYESCWQTWGADRLSSKIPNVAGFLVTKADELRKEISRRYELSIQIILGGIAAIQLYEIVKDLVPQFLVEPMIDRALIAFGILLLYIAFIYAWRPR